MKNWMNRSVMIAAIAAGLAIVAFSTIPAFSNPEADTNSPGTDVGAATHGTRFNGPTVTIGDGTARTYAILDVDNAPIELGVAIDAAGLEGLPQHDMVMNRLRFPVEAPAPYSFAMFDWNPMGHEPPGIYDLPHFDFHFYIAPETEVDGIIPGTDRFAAEANRLPGDAFIAPFHTVLAPPGGQPADVAVPQMGVHLSDVRSPELQAMLGKPEANAPFTKAFIYGSWNGKITFLEPMITREYLLKQQTEVVPISRPADYAAPGWYPGAYRISFDAAANEYRVALTEFVRHD